jgi:hypothetical protein
MSSSYNDEPDVDEMIDNIPSEQEISEDEDDIKDDEDDIVDDMESK